MMMRAAAIIMAVVAAGVRAQEDTAACPADTDFLALPPTLPVLVECGVASPLSLVPAATSSDPQAKLLELLCVDGTPEATCPMALTNFAQEMATCNCPAGTFICGAVQTMIMGALSDVSCATIR